MNKKRPFAPSYESDGVMGKNSKTHPHRSERQPTGKQAPDFFNTTPSSE
ncbi:MULTISPECIES: hypothetical protein [Geobacillus]|uniref:Uncharacterized protein n=2 Tax=Geobacillus TaxID=129337 RepID=A0A679FP91_9BACL|nr:MULTISPECIES: hypothetical protein [Geobacillus]KYD27934.1 hypothetical protein B4113_4151 [Geobacillus sp. B4113_201601]MEB3749917.1 hypothetical protein [Geobacillus icigianus]TWG30417.1 hypothetical protein GC56T2_1557 [Geobacillus sp. C56-T2]BBW96057.1 hypothetical protein GsuE55_08900 [Geobacillus subterraneus]